MYKWFVALTLIYFLGDPSLSYLEKIGGIKDFVVVAVISLIAVPWVVSQLDN